MIKEFLTSLFESPKLKEAKSFGHLYESIALIAREERCSEAWLPHRNQCKKFILESLKLSLHYESVLILGSGPLHEIPIEELSKKFKKVVCVDIVHLKSTKKRVQHLNNIEFREHDLTESENELTKGILKTVVPTAFIDENWGLVLSVNIMSQLSRHLENYIDKKFKKKLSEEEVNAYLDMITQNHLRYLESFHSPVALITDTEVHYLDSNNKMLENHLEFQHLKLPTPKAEWIWDLAPIPEFQKDIAIKMKVGAYHLNNRNSH